MNPTFSILIPGIFERLDKLTKLAGELERQIKEGALEDDVEIISVLDNRIVTVGEKRQMVLDASHGQYVAFVDDDDFVEPSYVLDIMTAITEHPGVDVITFDNRSFIEEHEPIIINMRLGQVNEDVHFPGGAKRAAWHTCAWRAGIAKRFQFPHINYGEDWGWAKFLNDAAKTEHHIDKVLHVYIYQQAISRATG